MESEVVGTVAAEEIRLTVLGVPVPQPRQRHAVVAGKVRNYTPANHPVQQFKALLQWEARAQGLPPAPWDGPLVLGVTFYLPRPARLMRRRDPDGVVQHTGKPDVDNLVKAVQDALLGLLWRDDSQICEVRARKFYAEKDGRPRVELMVRVLEASPP